jgi:hypothetical protein
MDCSWVSNSTRMVYSVCSALFRSQSWLKRLITVFVLFIISGDILKYNAIDGNFVFLNHLWKNDSIQVFFCTRFSIIGFRRTCVMFLISLKAGMALVIRVWICVFLDVILYFRGLHFLWLLRKSGIHWMHPNINTFYLKYILQV